MISYDLPFFGKNMEKKRSSLKFLKGVEPNGSMFRDEMFHGRIKGLHRDL